MPTDQLDNMSLLVIPDDILKMIIEDLCLVHKKHEIRKNRIHPGVMSVAPNYITDVSTPALNIRAASKLFRELCPVVELRRVNQNAYKNTRVFFFEDAAAKTFESLMDSWPWKGVVDGTVQAHIMYKGMSHIRINVHADITTIPGVPGWNNRCSLHYDVSVVGTDNNGVSIERNTEGGLDIPEVFSTKPLDRTPDEKQDFQDWADNRQPLVVQKWYKNFVKMHRELASAGSIMFTDMLDEPEIADDSD